MKFSYAAILLMMLINYLMPAHSIKCYQCRSDVDEHCDTLDRSDTHLQECSKLTTYDAPFCRKISQGLYFITQNAFVVIRECAHIHAAEEKCYNSPWKDSKVITCDCATEGCNSVHSIQKKKSFWTIFLYTILGAVILPRRLLLRNI